MRRAPIALDCLGSVVVAFSAEKPDFGFPENALTSQ
jgi:hypothetical protein